MSPNPMPYSSHPAPSQTPMHFRGVGVSKKLYNTSTQPRNNNHNHHHQQHTQYYERRNNVINGIGLEVGSHHTVSQQYIDSHTNGRTTSQLMLPSKMLPSASEKVQPNPLQQGILIVYFCFITFIFLFNNTYIRASI